MIVVSAGMRKAGSLWYYTLTRDLLVAAGLEDADRLDPRFPVGPLAGDGKMKCGRIGPATAARLGAAAALGLSFPIKTHAGPNAALRLLTASGRVRATYVYRDPRDVVLSLLDHARRARTVGLDLDLTALDGIRDALQMVDREVAAWREWMAFDGALTVRYEDLVADTAGELRRLADHLGLEVPAAAMASLAAPYERKAFAARGEAPVFNALHLNKGVPGRFRTAMTPEQLDLCNEHLGPHLSQMGYA